MPACAAVSVAPGRRCLHNTVAEIMKRQLGKGMNMTEHEWKTILHTLYFLFIYTYYLHIYIYVCVSYTVCIMI